MPHIAEPYFRQDPQPWALQQARQRHDEALYRRGEYAIFVLLWQVTDREAGRVGACTECVVPYGEVGEAFGEQPAKAKCPTCLGTGFEGGHKAKLVRPSIWDTSTTDDSRRSKRGVTKIEGASVQTTSDFALRSGDFILRADGSRWSSKRRSTDRLPTGFGPANNEVAISFNYTGVVLEPPDSVVYLVDPTPEQAVVLLNPAGNAPVDFSAVDEVRPNAVLL